MVLALPAYHFSLHAAVWNAVGSTLCGVHAGYGPPPGYGMPGYGPPPGFPGYGPPAGFPGYGPPAGQSPRAEWCVRDWCVGRHSSSEVSAFVWLRHTFSRSQDILLPSVCICQVKHFIVTFPP